MTFRKLFILMIAFIALGAFASGIATGADYPKRTIEMICAAGAGGGADAVARAFAKFATDKLGKPVMVVNKPGGGCVIGASYALKTAKPDGYTIFQESHSACTMLAAGMKKPPLDLGDRIFVSRIVTNSAAYAVQADAPWKDFLEFSEWVKQNPEKLTWATIGPSGFSAYGVQAWLAAIGADNSKTRMVPTHGAADSLTKLAGKHVVLACHTVGECYNLHKAGKIKVLAYVADERSNYLPDVPCTKELGLDVSMRWWIGFSFRPGTPEHIVKTWEKLSEEICSDPAFQEKIATYRANVSYLDGQQFKEYCTNEAKALTKIAEKVGIRK